MHSDQPRRVFLQNALTAAGLAVTAVGVTTILASCETNETDPVPPVEPIKINIADHPDLTGPGTIVLVDTVAGLNGGAPFFISQIGPESFAVFSAVCTHQGCIVNPPPSPGEDCICLCHFSTFAPESGAVRPGKPALTNLKAFSSTFNASTRILSVTP